ncbi:MAG: hypothetical protein ACTS6G_05765 [Candidatus Hodgkinia cicadicola]
MSSARMSAKRYRGTSQHNIHESVVRIRCYYIRKVENISRNKIVGIVLLEYQRPTPPFVKRLKLRKWDNKFKRIKLCAVSFQRSTDLMQYL